MIFVIVGTQAPFDRMVKIVDSWAENNPTVKIIAQIGDSEYKPKNIESFKYIPPVEFNDIFSKAELIVGHAGMGTIITALEMGKPIITMPRLSKYKEHRNDHQVHTANSFNKLGYIENANSFDELCKLLDNSSNINTIPRIGKFASVQLINELKQTFNTN